MKRKNKKAPTKAGATTDHYSLTSTIVEIWLIKSV